MAAGVNSAADLSARAGKTYFYRDELAIAYGERRNDLRLQAVDDAEGMLLLSKAPSSNWKLKN